jgi:nitroimidazol reductase NimA-like FMN-containing flavoprotein (pyridoxamine 5'-phosphate oxidase superfamily)
MIEPLDDDQIDAFLRQQMIGRIGMHADGETYVVPVIYAWDGTAIYVQSIEGRKISMMRQSPEVCFEVDEYERGSWRSVIVDGTYEELAGEAVEQALALLVARFAGGSSGRSRPRAEGRTPVAFRIVPRRLSGRTVQR